MPGGGSQSGTMSIHEGHDSFVGSGFGSPVGTIAVSENHDALVASATVNTSALFAKTESHDSFSAVCLSVYGSFSRTGNPDVLAATGTCIVGTMAKTEHADSFAGIGAFKDSGSASITESRDSLAASGHFLTTGSFSASGGNDSAAMSGTLTIIATGTLLAGGSDSFAGTGVQNEHGSLSVTEHHDAFAGSAAMGSTGSFSAVEHGDSLRGFSSGLQYHVYANSGIGDPIDYGDPIATTGLLTWTSSALAHPGVWRFGVRAFNAFGEELNLDASVTIILNAAGIDITNLPVAPTNLRAFATANGGIRVEWTQPPVTGLKAPTGFHVYWGTGGTPNYSAIKATVLAGSAIAGSFVANLSGLMNAIAYTFGVRAYNSTAEETNVNSVTVVADSAGPAPVVSLTATVV